MGQAWLFLQQLYTKMQYGCIQTTSHVFTCIPKCSMAVYESAVAFLPVYESAVRTSIQKCSMASIRKCSMCVYEMNGTPFRCYFGAIVVLKSNHNGGNKALTNN